MIKKVQKEHVPETESDCKTGSSFRALFYRVSRAFGCDQNVHVALVIRGARRSTRNLPYVTITHSYVLAFFATRFLLLFRSHFCRNCSFTRRYQHDSVLELFPHFGRRTMSFQAQFQRKGFGGRGSLVGSNNYLHCTKSLKSTLEHFFGISIAGSPSSDHTRGILLPYSKKISSKATVWRFVRNLFSSNVGHRLLLFDRPVIVLLLIVDFHIHEYF